MLFLAIFVYSTLKYFNNFLVIPLYNMLGYSTLRYLKLL
jgi:hypothetical protein